VTCVSLRLVLPLVGMIFVPTRGRVWCVGRHGQVYASRSDLPLRKRPVRQDLSSKIFIQIDWTEQGGIGSASEREMLSLDGRRCD
jgi:hypothetical protein